MYNEKFSTNDDSLKYADKNIYFRDVYLFVKRIQNIVWIKNFEIIRNNLYICLRDTIIKWYIDVFTKNQKRLIWFEENAEKWIRILLKRFRELSQTTVIIIMNEHYIMNDARRRRELFKYIQIITRTIKIIRMSIFNQLTLIFNKLNVKF